MTTVYYSEIVTIENSITVDEIDKKSDLVRCLLVLKETSSYAILPPHMRNI